MYMYDIYKCEMGERQGGESEVVFSDAAVIRVHNPQILIPNPPSLLIYSKSEFATVGHLFLFPFLSFPFSLSSTTTTTSSAAAVHNLNLNTLINNTYTFHIDGSPILSSSS